MERAQSQEVDSEAAEHSVVAPRANWKGFLKIAELSCQVALYTAASTSERIALHTLNRATGHRVRRQFVDEETGSPVESDEQVKGYEVGQQEYVVLEPEEIASVVPTGEKTLAVQAFIPCADVDTAYFDRPYYLAPGDPAAAETFALIREGMRAKKVAALARAVLFRRVRAILLRAYGNGLIASTLKFNYEVRSAREAFDSIPDMKIESKMLDLAKHIITTQRGTFDPTQFEDRYEAALAELVKAKQEGRPIEIRRKPQPGKVIDLMEALQRSAQLSGAGGRPETRRRKGAAPDASRTAARKKRPAASQSAASTASRRRKAS